MAGCLVAKAKVAGSNPVFRSKRKAPESEVASLGSGAFVFLLWRRQSSVSSG